MLDITNKIINVAQAQDLIPCPDGTMADINIGCVKVPASILNPNSSLVELILKFTSGLMSFIAIATIITLIYGAIKYVIASGNDEKINKAKKIMLYATIGLILALLAGYISALIASLIR